MERSAQSPTQPSPLVSVFEPKTTRQVQVMMCASFVACFIVLRINSHFEGITVADCICVPLALGTIVHHLVVLIVAFRQRRGKYRAREIGRLAPTTATLGVLLSCWLMASVWMVVTILYMTELRWRPTKIRVFTAIETVVVFVVAGMCSRERLEMLERWDEERPNVVFLMGEHGEYMALEGP